MQQIRIVAFKEGDTWIAQCLEVDVCVQANDFDALRNHIEIALEAEMPLDAIPRAPERFFEMWESFPNSRKQSSTNGVPYEMALCA